MVKLSRPFRKDDPAPGPEAGAEFSTTHSPPSGASADAAATTQSVAAGAGVEAPATDAISGDQPKGAAEAAAAPAAASPTVDLAVPLKNLPPLPARVAAAAQLVVKAKAARGIRRAGRRWTHAETVVPLADLTKAQRAAIEADPDLIVTVRVPAPGA